MRINWLSNAPWCATGYGVQTKLFVPRLEALGHEMSITANWGLNGGELTMPKNIRVYPATGEDTYGNDIAAAHARKAKADVLLSLYDAWVFNPAEMNRNAKWMPWFPVDMYPLPPIIRDAVAQAHKRIVFSRFAESALAESNLDCEYIPHGFNPQHYHPSDRHAARETLNLPHDKFVLGMVAANKGIPSRKAFAEVIAAFDMLRKKKLDVHLYLHTEHGDGKAGRVNLAEIVNAFGLNEHVTFASQYEYLLGYSDELMCDVYNAIDVLVSPSLGEGFGVPIIEAQACGTPVIVGNWTAMPELVVPNNGWLVRKNHPYWNPLGSYYFIPDILDIYNQMIEAYKRAHAVDREYMAEWITTRYSADNVTAEYWQPFLNRVAEELGV